MASFQNPALEFQVARGIVDNEKILSEQNFYAQKNVTPQQITNKIIYYLGRMNPHSFPLATKIMGGGYFNTTGMATLEGEETKPFNINTTIKYIENTNEFSYPVMTNYRNGSPIAVDYAGSNAGKRNMAIKVLFKTNSLIKNCIIRSPQGILARVENIENKHPHFEYTLRLAKGDADKIFPDTELKAGVVWINMFTAVAESGSRNIDIARMMTPSAYKNQINKLRTGLTWEGEAALKTTSYAVFNDKKPDGTPVLDEKTNKPKVNWLDQYTYNYEIDNLTMLEAAFWYSEYNRNSQGTINLLDPNTGKPIALGAGILQQVLNKTTYSKFSYKFLQKLIGKAFYGVRGTPKTKTLYTGTLGLRLFDAAMKEAGKQLLTDWGFIAREFVTGSDYNMMLGGFFDGFYHVDGWVIKVKKVDIFDNGGLITNSPIDPESGLPCESARMVLLDDSDYEGEPNIQLVLKKGFEPYTHSIMRGFNHLPPSLAALDPKSTSDPKDLGVVSTDEEKSSYMRMYQAGVQLLRGNTSLDLRYKPL